MNQIEDLLAGGGTLKEAAANLGLSVDQLGPFDAKGNSPQGTPIKAMPQLDKFLDVAFKTPEHTESSVITAKGGVYYILRVDSVTPEKLRPMAEAKADVAKAFTEVRNEKNLNDIASLIEKEQTSGKSAKEIIAAHKLSSTTSGTVARDSKTLGEIHLPPALVTQIFGSDIGTLTHPLRDKDGSYLLATVDGVATSTGSGDGSGRKKELLQQMQEEMMMQYVRHLETLYPVKINDAALDRLTRDNSDATR